MNKTTYYSGDSIFTSKTYLLSGFIANIILVLFIKVSSAAGQSLFRAGYFSYKDQGSINYRLLKPEHIKKGKKYPLVLFFHGSGQRGDNNISQLKWGVRQFATKRNRRKYPAFVVAPQCPFDAQWVNMNYNNFPVKLPSKPSKYITLSLELVLHLEKKYPIDTRRIYVTGISSGGYATWAAIERMPYLFAAAVPIAGGGDPSKANLIAHMSIWAFQGKRDREVPIKFMNSMIKALRKYHGHPRYTVYKKLGHQATWIKAYHKRDLYRWLFRQKKKKRKMTKH